MNPRQRKGLLFLLVALLVGAGTFFAVTAFVANVNSQVGARVTVYQAKVPIQAYTPLSAENIVPVEVPRRWVSDTSVLSISELTGRRVGFPVSAGTTLSSDMLVPSSSLSSTEREIAINVDAVTGVAGRLRTGDRVDIYAVFSEVPGLPKSVRVIVTNVRVVSIAGQQTVTQQTSQGMSQREMIPVTLALEPEAALSVTYANAFAQEVRLVALPNDVGVNRTDEPSNFDAGNLGGRAVPEGER